MTKKLAYECMRVLGREIYVGGVRELRDYLNSPEFQDALKAGDYGLDYQEGMPTWGTWTGDTTNVFSWEQLGDDRCYVLRQNLGGGDPWDTDYLD